ncbi:hypothetical protein [Qiania dongpingensis]|uniref:Lipoprotein n=1 Tax=Qiania dongpingensis TaxID=2763669 RepID=A0A7G9G6U3_9FIRM|nr:hypothetical protein [Qiania dongpingensis]QNM06525.1 hypothetical protein H9Q78_05175 [Qiania dongpingensis]
MKTSRLVIGILSIVLAVIVLFQSCAVGIGNALQANEEVSGSAGLMVAVILLVAGIIGIVTRNGGKGPFVAGAFYALGGILGLTNAGSYGDLILWSVVCFLFAAVFIIGNLIKKKS